MIDELTSLRQRVHSLYTERDEARAERDTLRNWLREAADPACKNCDGTGIFYGNVHICSCLFRHAAEAERDALKTEALEMLAVPAVWSEEERDGMASAFAKASQKHGHYEALFAVVAWLLRHRARAFIAKHSGNTDD